MKTSNKDITELLRSVAAVYLLHNENRFRIIAYEKAADSIEQLNREVFDLWENNALTTVPGLGPTIRQHLQEYFTKPEKSYLVKTISKIPASVFVLMKIPGLGAKKAFKLVSKLKLVDEKTVLDDLIAAAKQHKIAELESFGKKSEEEIVKSVELFKKNKDKIVRMPLPYAYGLAEEMKEYLLQNPHVQMVDTLGSLRRMVSTIGDVDLAVVAEKTHFKSIIDHFISYSGCVKVENKGDEKASILTSGSRRIDLRIAEKSGYGAMLQYFTGSKSHNIKLREYALKKGCSLSEYGIKKIPGRHSGKPKAERQTSQPRSTVAHPESRSWTSQDDLVIQQFKTEKEFYGFLGLDYIPPELREGINEIELAKKHKLPKLVEFNDIKGDFHLHSSYDLKPSHDLGANTYQEIIEKAEILGYEYVGFSDHNPRVGNQTSDQIIRIMETRKHYIDRLLSKKSKRLHYFISCEVDITPDGTLALPEKALDYVDMIIVSIHSSFRQSREIMTKRILKALLYPKVKVLGHPTGRLLGKREEIDVDWPTVISECVKRNIALEINAWSERLDLPDTLVAEAKKMGAKFAIDTDAHATPQMDNMFYGVSVARRGGLEKGDVINTKHFTDFKKWIY